MIVLILAGGAILVTQNFDIFQLGSLFSPEEVSQSSETGYPKKLYGDRALSFGKMGNFLQLVSDSKLYLYDESGAVVYQSPHSYTNPVSVSSEKRMLTYDQGGNHFRVDSTSSTISDKEMLNSIWVGAIADNGSVAIATSEERYAGSVTVFDSTGKQIYKWYSSGMQITGLAFYPGGNGVAVSCIGAENGMLKSRIYYLDFSITEEDKIAKSDFYDTMILSIDYKSNGQLMMIGDNMVAVTNNNGEVVSQYAFDRTIQKFSNDPSGNAVLLLDSYNNNSKGTLMALDTGCNVIGSAEIPATVTDLSCSDSRIAVLSGQKVSLYDLRLNPTAEMEARSDAKNLSLVGNKLYVLGLGDITQYDVK